MPTKRRRPCLNAIEKVAINESAREAPACLPVCRAPCAGRGTAMDIVKRSGATEAYDGSKTVAAIAGAFSDVYRRSIPRNACRFVACGGGIDRRRRTPARWRPSRTSWSAALWSRAISTRRRPTSCIATAGQLRTVRADRRHRRGFVRYPLVRSRAVRRLLPRRLSRVHSGRFPWTEPYALSALSAKFRALSKPTCPLTSALNP